MVRLKVMYNYLIVWPLTGSDVWDTAFYAKTVAMGCIAFNLACSFILNAEDGQELIAQVRK
jgi:hypothetical protein